MIYEGVDISKADELLSPSVTDEIMRKAEQWVYSFAARLQVRAEDVKQTFLVEELLKAYALREVCYVKSFGLGGSAWQPRMGERSTIDYYGQKLAYYERMIKDLERTMTPYDLTGEERNYPAYRMVTIERG